MEQNPRYDAARQLPPKESCYNPALMRTVFLSSTAKDLTAHREASYRAIEGMDGYHCVRMEDFGARSAQADDLCVQKIRESDLILFLIGPSYGSRNPKGISYTQSEYDAAMQSNKHCLVFMTSDNFLLPAALREDDESARAQQAFRRLLQNTHVVKTFTQPDELPGLVTQAISNWQTTRPVSAIRWRKLTPLADPTWTRREGTAFGIGRSTDNEIFIDDPAVSWEHGNIFRRKSSFFYRQVGKAGPSVISREDSELLLKPGDNREVQLQNQDQLKTGSTTILLQFDLLGVDAGYVRTAPTPDI
jgi:hypothetical protein